MVYKHCLLFSVTSLRMSALVWLWRLLAVWTLLAVSSSQRNGLNAVDFSQRFGSALPSLSRPANASQIFYGVMFDAGSTGTRIHVYTFIQKEPGEMITVRPSPHRQQVWGSLGVGNKSQTLNPLKCKASHALKGRFVAVK